MSSEQYAAFQASEVRRPSDIPTATPLTWQAEKHAQHTSHLMDNHLPADFPYAVKRGDAGDALAVLALRESIRRDMEYGRGTRVHEALLLGATWTEIAAALDISTAEARQGLRKWADGQRSLFLSTAAEETKTTLGLDTTGYRAVCTLTNLADDETAPGAETEQPS
ncbi:hypothetical protein ACFU99_36810 [Streptomyces sp. NPDC057654]|uniref:hypothetical protein n=1 Tax=Streptomyces sp. NPDC057654 TaxID=3346196 RepID=UPI0036CA0331